MATPHRYKRGHAPRIQKELKRTTLAWNEIPFVTASTNDSNEDVKEEFHSRLSTIIHILARQNITIMLGDLNAKIGSDNRCCAEIMGQQGLGEMNNNGERFTDLCFGQSGCWRKCLPVQKDAQSNLACQQKTRQTMYLLGGGLEVLFKTSARSMPQLLFQISIYLLSS